MSQPPTSFLPSKLIELILERGHTKHSPIIFLLWALVLSVLGEFEESECYRQLSLRMKEVLEERPDIQDDMVESESVYLVVLAGFSHHFYHPLPECASIAMDGYTIGMDTGDMTFGMLNAAISVRMKFWVGNPLTSVENIACSLSFHIR